MSVAGRVLRTSSGTKPIPASYGLFADFKLHYAKMSSRVSAARNLAMPHRTKGPVVASSSPAGTHVARPSTKQPRPLLLANEECPHYPTELAPASVGARVMERVSPRELCRMPTTG